MHLDTRFAKCLCIGKTIEQPEGAIAQVRKWNALARDGRFRIHQPEEHSALPGLEKAVPIARFARVVINLEFSTSACARRIHGVTAARVER